MNLAKLEQSQMAKHYELQELQFAFEKKKKEIEAEIADIEKQKGLLLANMDEAKVKMAESILRFSYGFSRLEHRVVKKAIEDIANGCQKLCEQYFGIKDYAHWRGQQADHTYGYGPKHGSVVFSIGLNQPKQSLTDEQQEACIYFLYQLMENRPFVDTLLKREIERKKVRTS